MRMSLVSSTHKHTPIHTHTRAHTHTYSLVDRKKLPHMAMLRNLNNLLDAGLLSAYHAKVLSRLGDRRTIINGRQFPFRYYAAYRAVDEQRIRYNDLKC